MMKPWGWIKEDKMTIETHHIHGYLLSRVIPPPEFPRLAGLPSNENMIVKTVVKRRGRIEGLGLKAIFVETPKKGRVVKMDQRGVRAK